MGKQIHLEDDHSAAVKALRSPRSSDRRSAAKRLKALGRSADGPLLLDALLEEVKDPRTWETQYEMILAIAACQFRGALPELRRLATRIFDSTVIYRALGYAISVLERRDEGDASTAVAFMESGAAMLLEGALIDVVLSGASPSEHVQRRFISHARQLDDNQLVKYLIVEACARWASSDVKSFLLEVVESTNPLLSRAAAAAMDGRHDELRLL